MKWDVLFYVNAGSDQQTTVPEDSTDGSVVVSEVTGMFDMVFSRFQCKI